MLCCESARRCHCSCAAARRVHVVPCSLLLCLPVFCVLPLLCPCRSFLAGVPVVQVLPFFMCVGVWSSGLCLGLALCTALLVTHLSRVVPRLGATGGGY
jgi:hypothetical protein